MNSYTLKETAVKLLKNREIKFAVIQVTTKCNAKCLDRCNIWASPPIDMEYKELCFTLDVLAKNRFSVAYLTGGETGMYPSLVPALHYAKSKGLITSLTTNGTIQRERLIESSKHLDALSVSVDHYDETIWDQTKHRPGISKEARETIKIAKAQGISVYAVTFLNPSWTPTDVEKAVKYVNEELEIPFGLSYPYISAYNTTFTVGGRLRENRDYLKGMAGLVSKVLEMKLKGFNVATSTCYLRDVIRAHNDLPLRYPCKAGRTILTIDCRLNVFPCYKKAKLFNLRDNQNLNLHEVDSSKCDNKYCMINCFKEASEPSRETGFRALVEELLSNPRFYLSLVH